ncbi:MULTISPECIES: hypothetical protein [Caproicibacterium]|uniref:Uncharacterized protein n=1 Tax=Caproicibacterium argilliputei TaxID=3030016 RepID=A0AA97H2Q8_9FIRM|nr:hypothetical protein [Caproicibacterium argilliputei]WOC32955.1 hypothetical protein PXC00_03495 [Caproicibacterium argilliputei]
MKRNTEKAKPNAKPEPQDKDLLGYTDDYLNEADNVVSAQECTGLIMYPPLSESEAESFTDLYSIPKPENKKPNGLQKEKKEKHDFS